MSMVSLPEGDLPAVKCDDRLSREEIPVLRSPSVALETEALPRIDDDPLDLVVNLVGEDRVVSPGTVIRFHHACLQQSEFS